MHPRRRRRREYVANDGQAAGEMKNAQHGCTGDTGTHRRCKATALHIHRGMERSNQRQAIVRSHLAETHSGKGVLGASHIHSPRKQHQRRRPPCTSARRN